MDILFFLENCEKRPQDDNGAMTIKGSASMGLVPMVTVPFLVWIGLVHGMVPFGVANQFKLGLLLDEFGTILVEMGGTVTNGSG